MAKAAIVFGGAGFIGSHLLRLLSESGEYSTLVAADIAQPRFTTPGVVYKTVDLRQPIPDDLCPEAAEIYNLAAVHTTPGHADWEYYWTNVLGATHVCDFARRRGIDRIVFTSSISIYGPSEEPKDESATPAPNSAYGCSKLCAEKIHRLWREERPEQRKLVVARPAVIYGYKEGGNFTRLARSLARGRFAYPGRTDTVKSAGYVKDLVRSFRFALERPEPSIAYNFCHPRQHTISEICAGFSRVAGYAPARFVIPLGPMLGVGWCFEMLARMGLKTSINRARVWKLVRSNNFIPAELERMGFEYRYDLDQSLEDWKKSSTSGGFD